MHVPVERRLEPARAHEQRQLLAHLEIVDRRSNMPVLAAPQMNGWRNHLLQAPARASGASRTDTSALSSQSSRSASIGRSWRQGARQHGAIDAARGCAGDDVDDRRAVRRCGRSRAGARNRSLRCRIRGRCRSSWSKNDALARAARSAMRVQRARRAHQLQNLLADAVHVDGERNAAEADERNAKFLLAQDPALIPVNSHRLADDAGEQPNTVNPWWLRSRCALAHSRRP